MKGGFNIAFLPVTYQEIKERGWEQVDFLYISGDAYVDHPSFGHAIITRLLEKRGFKVGIIAQPDYKGTDDFKRLGRPKYAVFISSGVVDSMVNHYTAAKKKRSQDAYSPGGVAGKRPDRALIVYSNRIREVFGDIPVILGGMEASLRRFAHYDYWDNKVRRSVLIDSKANGLIYGMGEKPVIEIAEAFASGKRIEDMKDIRGTAWRLTARELAERNNDARITDGETAHKAEAAFIDIEDARITDSETAHKAEAAFIDIEDARIINDQATHKADNAFSEIQAERLFIPSFEEVKADKTQYAKTFALQYTHSLKGASNTSQVLIQPHGDKYVMVNPPSLPLTENEMDEVYNLPYERRYHPMYERDGGVPAIEEVAFSITSHRGCIGSCSFCALGFHQGRTIQKRSGDSILKEAQILINQPNFKGYIHDVGGPTANFRNAGCKLYGRAGICHEKQCLYPKPCGNLVVSHKEYLGLLKKLRKLDRVKKVFIRSGIRYDFLLLDKDQEFFDQLCSYHVSGQLKIAPEHISGRVLALMNKPESGTYEQFKKLFIEKSKKAGLEQYLVPYFMSSHPGCDIKDAIELACYFKKTGCIPEQVQDFYPTPGTVSTCIYYTGLHPFTLKSIYVPSGYEEKALQRALLQFNKPENRHKVILALKKAGFENLIGYGNNCLVKPENRQVKSNTKTTQSKSNKFRNNKKTGK